MTNKQCAYVIMEQMDKQCLDIDCDGYSDVCYRHISLDELRDMYDYVENKRRLHAGLLIRRKR